MLEYVEGKLLIDMYDTFFFVIEGLVGLPSTCVIFPNRINWEMGDFMTKLRDSRKQLSGKDIERIRLLFRYCSHGKIVSGLDFTYRSLDVKLYIPDLLLVLENLRSTKGTFNEDWEDINTGDIIEKTLNENRNIIHC